MGLSAHRYLEEGYLRAKAEDAGLTSDLLAAAEWALAYLDTSDMPYDEQGKRNALSAAIAQAKSEALCLTVE